MYSNEKEWKRNVVSLKFSFPCDGKLYNYIIIISRLSRVQEEKVHQQQNADLQHKLGALQHSLDAAVLSHSSALVAMQSKFENQRRQALHEQNMREDVQRVLEEEKALRIAAQAAATASKYDVERVRSEASLEIEALRGKVYYIAN